MKKFINSLQLFPYKLLCQKEINNQFGIIENQILKEKLFNIEKESEIPDKYEIKKVQKQIQFHQQKQMKYQNQFKKMLKKTYQKKKF